MSSFPQQPQSFDPIRSYDRPNVFLTQMLENEASFDSFRRTFFTPSALSPKERNSYSQSIKDRLGNHAATNALVDIATNPFTWLMFLVSPPAVQSMKATGRIITGGAYSAFLKEKGGFLRMIGITSAANEAAGTPVIPVIQDIGENLRKLDEEHIDTIGKPLEDLLERIYKETGVRVNSLDPEKTADPLVKSILEDIDDALFVRSNGWDTRREVGRGGYTPVDRSLIEVALVDEATGNVIVPWSKTLLTTSEAQKLKTLMDKRSKQIDKVKEFRNDFMTRNQREPTPTEIQNYWNRSVDPRARSEPLQIDEVSIDALNDPRQRPFAIDPASLSGDLDLSRTNIIDTVGPVPQFGTYRFRSGVSFEKELPKAVDRTRYADAFLDRDAVRAVFDKWGLDEYFLAGRKILNDRKKALFYRDGMPQGAEEVDVEKLLRLGAGLSADQKLSRVHLSNPRVAGLLSDLLGDEVLNLVKQDPEVMVPKVKKLVKEVFENSVNSNYYLPRNLLKTINRNGDVVDPGLVYLRNEQKHLFPGTSIEGRRVGENFLWDHRDLDRLQRKFGLADDFSEGQKHFKWMRRKAKSAELQSLRSKGEATLFKVGYNESMRRYVDNTARTHAMYVSRLRARTISSLQDSLPDEVIQEMGGFESFGRFRPGFDAQTMTLPQALPTNLPDPYTIPMGGLSNADILEASIKSLKSQRTRQFITDDIIPTVLGEVTVEDTAFKEALEASRKSMKWLVNGPIGEAIGKMGPWGARFREEVNAWSDSSRELGSLSGISGNMAKLLYVSHLGMNMSSVMMNMMQPLTMGMPMLGSSAMFGGWLDALGSMLRYAHARSKLGIRITDAQREQLLAETMTETIDLAGDGISRQINFAELADIGKTPFEMVDVASLRHGFRKAPGKASYYLLELGMKPFEKAEWFNRLAMAHAVKRSYKSAGRLNTTEELGRLRTDASDIVQRTQFGSDPLNRPRIFYRGVLTNPLARQFLQFPVRQVSGTFLNPLQIGEGGVKNLFSHVTKAMGYSAITYELGKNLIGADLSRGLFVGSVTEAVGGERFFTSQNATEGVVGAMMPPAVDILASSLKAVGTGEWDLLRQTIPRVVPNGIALSKVLGLTGKMPVDLGLQRNYADWGNIQNGQVPYYKHDGRFLGYYDANQLILKSLGVDMAKFKESQDISGFLLKNRNAMRDFRRKWISSVLGNNLSEAESIKAEYEKRFGLPLTVSKQQMSAAVKLREESMVSRILQTTETGARGQFESQVPGNYFDKAPETQLEAQAARYLWSNMQMSEKPDLALQRELTGVYMEPQ